MVEILFEERCIDIRVNKFRKVGMCFVGVVEIGIFGILKLVIGLLYFLVRLC